MTEGTRERQLVAFLADPDSRNGRSIHTNTTARDYGYRAALITGGVVYGWCVPLILETLGEGWIENGWAEINYRRPVYPDDALHERLEPAGEGAYHFTVTKGDGEVCLSGAVGLGEGELVRDHVRSARRAVEPKLDPQPVLTLDIAPVGQELPALAFQTERDPAKRPSEIHPTAGRTPALLLRDRPVISPAQISALGSWYGHAQYDYGPGPSIHTATRTQYQGIVEAGELLTIAGYCRDAYERKGHHYWVTDITILAGDGREVARNRHTTIFHVGKRDDAPERPSSAGATSAPDRR